MDSRRGTRLRGATLRVRAVAAVLFGSKAAARRYMTTRNFALGGATPLQMLNRLGGEAAVMAELQTQRESGLL